MQRGTQLEIDGHLVGEVLAIDKRAVDSVSLVVKMKEGQSPHGLVGRSHCGRLLLYKMRPKAFSGDLVRSARLGGGAREFELVFERILVENAA